MKVDTTTYVVLDSGVLGLVTNPSAAPEPEACKTWLKRLLLGGVTVAVPEIADYEVRRELIRADKLRGLRTLVAPETRLSSVGCVNSERQTHEMLPINIGNIYICAATRCAMDCHAVHPFGFDVRNCGCASSECRVCAEPSNHANPACPARSCH